jgi:uncharacterized membrane protein
VAKKRDTARAAAAAPPPAATRDWPVAALAGAGLLVSASLAIAKWAAATPLLCQAGGGCDIVQASRYSTMLGLPTAAWGALLYAALLALALTGLPPRRWVWAFALAVLGVTFSLYLTVVQVAVIRALCPWCLLDAGIAVALLAVLLVRRPVGGRRSPTRPARLAWIGGATAVATVVLALGIFVAEPPGGSRSYQEALARHLAASGAIFYGAYW